MSHLFAMGIIDQFVLVVVMMALIVYCVFAIVFFAAKAALKDKPDTQEKIKDGIKTVAADQGLKLAGKLVEKMFKK